MKKLFQVQAWKGGELVAMSQRELTNDSHMNMEELLSARNDVLRVAEQKGARPLDDLFVCTSDSERFLFAATEPGPHPTTPHTHEG